MIKLSDTEWDVIAAWIMDYSDGCMGKLTGKALKESINGGK